MSWIVYRLVNVKNGRNYIGISNDPVKRLKAHRAGRGAAETREDPKAWKMQETTTPFATRQEAEKFEFAAQQHAVKYSETRAFEAVKVRGAGRQAKGAKARKAFDTYQHNKNKISMKVENKFMVSSFDEFKQAMDQYSDVRMTDKRVAVVYFTTRVQDGDAFFTQGNKRGYNLSMLAGATFSSNSFRDALSTQEPDDNEFVSDSPNYTDYDSIQGAFLPWLLNEKHPLCGQPEFIELAKDWGLFPEINDESLKVPCFINALISAKVDDIVISKARSMYRTRHISRKSIKALAEECGIHIEIHVAPKVEITGEEGKKTAKVTDREKDVVHYGDQAKPAISIGVIDGHYIHIKPIKMKHWAILNFPTAIKSWNSSKQMDAWYAKGFRVVHMRAPGKFLDGEESWTTNLNIMCRIRELENDGIPAIQWITPSTPGFGKTPLWDKMIHKDNMHVNAIANDDPPRYYHPRRLETGTTNSDRIYLSLTLDDGTVLDYKQYNGLLRCTDKAALPYKENRDKYMVGMYRVSMPELMDLLLEKGKQIDDEDNIDETDEEAEAGLYSLIGDIESIVLACLDGVKMIDADGAVYCSVKPDVSFIQSEIERFRGLDFTVPVVLEVCKKGTKRTEPRMEVLSDKDEAVLNRMMTKLGKDRMQEINARSISMGLGQKEYFNMVRNEARSITNATVYFDFETSPHGVHREYAVCAMADVRTINSGGEFLEPNGPPLKFRATGNDCALRFLEWITEIISMPDEIGKKQRHAPIVKCIAHNMSYDLSFLKKHMHKMSGIERVGKAIIFNGHYQSSETDKQAYT